MTSVLGIEIGGTKLQVAVGTSEGRILRVLQSPVEPGWRAPEIIRWTLETIAALKYKSVSEGNEVRAIGVGFGGPVDSAAGRVLTSHQIEGWDGFPLRNRIQETTELPVYVENDANTAGWAEYRCGAGRGTRNMVYMNIGSGIGGAFVCNGRLYNAQGFGAAEVGHTHVPTFFQGSGEPKTDKLENLCSGWAIERRARSTWKPKQGGPLSKATGGDPRKITCALLGRAAREGDPFATEEMDRVAHTLGIAMANVITLFCPERLVIGGGVALMGDVLLDPLRRYINRYVIGCFRGCFEIVPADLGQDVVLVGGLLLAGDISSPPPKSLF